MLNDLNHHLNLAPCPTEDHAKPLAEFLTPGKVARLDATRPTQWLAAGAREKLALVNQGIPAQHVWTLAEITSYLGGGVTLEQVAREFMLDVEDQSQCRPG